APRLRHRCEHAVSAAAAAREAGVPDERVEHRRGAASQVLPNFRFRHPPRRRPHHRMGRADPGHRDPHRHPRTGELIMAATLTERYISATIKTLPPETQDDVRVE